MKARNGFTLLELMVVIVVLGLLAGLVGPQILGRVSEAKTTTAQTQIEMLATALDTYRLDNGVYPSNEQGLDALRDKPAHGDATANWHGPYLRKPVPLDPWGRAYMYRVSDDLSSFEIVSLGADGRAGGTGDDVDLSSNLGLRTRE
ncbi:MAG TPA: type II secretion system major pseudopilin GspG [Longimicrobiales bacterium]